MIAHAAQLLTIPASTTPQAFNMVSDNLPSFWPFLYVLIGLLALFFLIATLTTSTAGGEMHETIDEWDL